MEIPFQQTKNYQIGTQKKKGYVLHQTIGNYHGSVEWLMNANRPNRTSAHYVIGRNEGEVIQLVKDTDDSWHAGNITNPAPYAKSRLLKTPDGVYINPNRYTIGIEFTSRYDVDGDGIVEPQEIDITDWQYRCAIEIFKKNQALIPMTADMMLISHKEICDYKSDDTIFIREGLLKRMFGEEIVKIDCPKSKVERTLAFIKSLV